MSTGLTEEPTDGRAILYDDADVWVRGTDGLWMCTTNSTPARDWDLLLSDFGPLHPAPGGADAVDPSGEVREFDVRCAALLAAATAFKRDGEVEDDWEDHEASIVAKARKFEPYLRGEAK